MKFKDKVVYGSTDDLHTNLRNIILVLNEEVSKLPLRCEPDYVLIALRAVTSYSSLLLERLIEHQDFPIEYNALSARNLFECYLLTAYMISDPTKAKNFSAKRPLRS